MVNQLAEKRPYVWPVGKGGFVSPGRIVAVARWDSAPIKRTVRIADIENQLIDLTFGKRCLWVLFLDSGHAVLISDPVPVASIDDKDDLIWRNRSDE